MSEGDSQVRHPPIRDATTLKNVLYGPGHEKFPSWPIAAAAEAPRATRAPPTGSSQRSKSWTDHTSYPKERPVAFSRPYMRRSHPQQLKTVLERCEKNSPDTFEYFSRMERIGDTLEHDGIPSPPERDTQHKSMQEYDMLLENQSLLRYSYNILSKEKASPLTLADLEEYTRNCEEINIQHQKQPSYAQSEGYHSYVSSTDSTSTPFLDRLRRDIDTTALRGSNSWDHDSVVTTSSGSASSSETLKWHGSLSDVSVASSSINLGRQQLIAHSARVQTPQRHNSESVLYIENNRSDVPIHHQSQYSSSSCSASQSAEPQSPSSLSYSPPSPQRSVAERVHQYEKQATKYTYLDPDKKTKISDPALKAIQKKALLLFYERHQGQNKNFWRSEPQLSFKSQNRAKSKYDEQPDEMMRSHTHHVKENSQIDTEVSYNHQSSKVQSCGDCDPHNSSGKVSNDPVMSYLMKQKESAQSRNEKSYKLTDNRPPSTLGYFKTSEQKNYTVKSPTNSSTDKLLKNNSETSNMDSCKSLTNGSVESFVKNSSPGFCKVNEGNTFNNHNSYPNVSSPTSNTPLINCENQNSDLQGPIIIGNSISIDDWVPERPPKNQELLRSAFPDLYREKSRYHSPELPLPSPPLPTCDDEVLSASDEPFPPPPLEIIDEWKYRQEVLDIHPHSEVQNYNQNISSEFQKINNKNNRDPMFNDVKHDNSNRLMHFNKSPVPPTKPKPLKRDYHGSNPKTNVASRRNSFANAQDVSRDIPMLNANIRASVREKSHSQGLSQKPIMSAQRQLYRSITVDQSVAAPKKPINPFLRSTSMKFDADYKNDSKTSNFMPEKSMQSERPSLQYHYAQKLTLNGKVALAKSEKVNKTSGQYRAEPLRATFKPAISEVSPAEYKKEEFKDVNIIWKANSEPKRHSLPTKYTECERTSPAPKKLESSNRSFDSSDSTNISFSFCKSDIENISAKTADVRSTNLESSQNQSLHWSISAPYNSSAQHKPSHWNQADKSMRRHNAVLSMGIEHDRGSPDVNIGSYKRISGSLDKASPSPQCASDAELTPPAQPPAKQDASAEDRTKPILVEPPSQSDPENGRASDDSISLESSSNSTENASPASESADKEFSLQISVEPNISIDSLVSMHESSDHCVAKSPTVAKGVKLQKLRPRTFLPEEMSWEAMRSSLVLRVPPDSSTLNLISQYDEYNNTIESITNIFELDAEEIQDDMQSPNDFGRKDLMTCGDDKSYADYSAEENENQSTIQRLQELKIVPGLMQDEYNIKNVKKCLSELLIALAAEGGRLEQEAAVNEAVGVHILATASKGARLARHAADVGRVTALIAGLATRLARATQPLKLPVHTPERRKMLMTKQEKLADQLEEAKRLKESIDARGLSLSDTLSAQLSADFKGQFRTFISTKVRLVVYSRDIQYRLDLTKQLLDSLPQDNNCNIINPDIARTQVAL